MNLENAQSSLTRAGWKKFLLKFLDLEQILCLGLYWSHPLATESSKNGSKRIEAQPGMVHNRQADSSNKTEPKPTSDRVSSVSTREVVF